LRRIRLTGPEIAELLEMATSMISAILKRIGLGTFEGCSQDCTALPTGARTSVEFGARTSVEFSDFG
jgi:hypothetical protein